MELMVVLVDNRLRYSSMLAKIKFKLVALAESTRSLSLPVIALAIAHEILTLPLFLQSSEPFYLALISTQVNELMSQPDIKKNHAEYTSYP